MGRYFRRWRGEIVEFGKKATAGRVYKRIKRLRERK